ncbi:TfoX/Sxy family protein [Brevirhabdus sp.]|uniref:TfoX/Sxy family protein n=1 Tax=Brevirhabdus sp. TaxID=2004514 RepID=UPI004059281F
MAYDKGLSLRIADTLEDLTDATPQQMMGAMVYMVGGHMCCGVSGDCLMVRVGADGQQDALSYPHTRPLDLGGRSPKGFILVEPEGCAGEDDLLAWLRLGLDHVATLPPK